MITRNCHFRATVKHLSKSCQNHGNVHHLFAPLKTYRLSSAYPTATLFMFQRITNILGSLLPYFCKNRPFANVNTNFDSSSHFPHVKSCAQVLVTSSLGWYKMAGVGGMSENTSSQDSEDTSDRRFSPRSQACRKYTTFSDGFFHEKMVPCVDRSPKSLRVVRMNGASSGFNSKTVNQPLSNKPVLRSRSEKICQESLVKKKRSNSQTVVEEVARLVVFIVISN